MLHMVVMLVMNTSMNKTNMKMCWRVNFTVEMRTSQSKVMAIMTIVVVDQATMHVLMLKVNTSMNKTNMRMFWIVRFTSDIRTPQS
jgi:hypothetical protein